MKQLNIKDTILKATIIFLPFIYSSQLYNHFSYPKVVFLLLSITILIILISIKESKISIPKIYQSFSLYFLLYLLAWLIWTALSLDFSRSMLWSLWRSGWLISIFISFCFWIIIISSTKREDRFKLFRLVHIPISLLAIIAIIQKYFSLKWSFILSYSIDWRSWSTVWQYNLFWAFLLFWLLSTILDFYHKKSTKAINAISLMIILIWIHTSWSRAALVMAILLLIFASSFLIRKKLQKIISTCILAIAIILIAIYSSRFAISEENMASLKSRELLAKNSIMVYIELPLSNKIFWNWFDSQQDVITKNLKWNIYAYEKIWSVPDKAHNIILDTLIETWLFWLFAIMMMTASLISIIIMRKIDSPWIIIIFTISIIALSWIFSFYNLTIVIYMLFCISLIPVQENEIIKIPKLYVYSSLVISIFFILIINNDIRNQLEYSEIKKCDSCIDEKIKFIWLSDRSELRAELLDWFTQKQLNISTNYISEIYFKRNDYLTKISALRFLINSSLNNSTKISLINDFLAKYPFNAEVILQAYKITKNDEYGIKETFRKRLSETLPKFITKNGLNISKFEKKKQDDLLNYLQIDSNMLNGSK